MGGILSTTRTYQSYTVPISLRIESLQIYVRESYALAAVLSTRSSQIRPITAEEKPRTPAKDRYIYPGIDP